MIHYHSRPSALCKSLKERQGERVTAENQDLFVETMRGIAEIVIWGDQNDSTIFECFMVCDMMGVFETILTNNPGPVVSVQLLQSLGIFFENISTPSSLCGNFDHL